jgi:cell wall-associated NlpC family hydrolase
MFKGILVDLLVFAAIGASGCSGHSVDETLMKLLAEARAKFAPDRRTAVFDVSFVRNGRTVTLKGEVQDPELKEQFLMFMRENSEFSVVDSLRALPEENVMPKTYGIVSLSVANIRTTPDHAAEMATQAIMGTPVKILKLKGGWMYVQTPDGYLGWTDDAIERMTSTEYEQWMQLPKVIVTSVYGFTYESPDPQSPVVSDIVAGGLFAVSHTDHRWYQVGYPDGRTAYLSRREAEPYPEWLLKTRDTPGSIVATARRFMGVPYLWGGTSTKGFDCSGFTKTVYYLNGVQLPRDADEQSLVGTSVDTTTNFEHLQSGDLLFFGPDPKRVTHVAISLGGGRFIHASGYVRINSLDPDAPDYSGFRRSSFLQARRIIGAGEQEGVMRLTHIPYYRGNEPQ